MSAYSIDSALAELESLINSCEQALMKSIEEKKMKSETAMSTTKINRQLQQNPIAIVGMASLFPKARNLQEYWRNIVNKTDCITDVPETHWSLKDYYDPDPRTTEDKTYCKRGGFIPEVDFNPMEFGIPPSILEVTDVSQLLSLVVAKEAMEDAGYGESREFDRETVGVILGVAQAKQLGVPLSARLEYPVWEKVLKSSGLSDEDTQKIVNKIKSAYVKWDENAFPGMLGNVVAGRIANRLNFGGTNCVVDAACASSFGALKMAISELVEHRCDMMLTGGVDTDNTITAYICFSKTPAVSPGDKVKPFDAKSDGMMLGEGIGMFVLKRLEDAERDKDKIYAIIKGIGTSSDGRYKSIYAPRKEGQVKALERAYNDAGFSPATVGLIEAHGTGTMVGDPTEFSSLKDFFNLHDPKKQHIALGSVKSQIGHTKAAAGAASLIKTALALHHKILPPTINITEPNPKLNIKNSAFYLNTETRPWVRAAGEPPRRAGVSSFGFGGTNYHVVLEEYATDQGYTYRLHDTPREILLFASTPAELLAKSAEILSNLQSDKGDRHYAQLLQSSQNQVSPQTAARIGFVSENLAEACKLLQIGIDWLKHKGLEAPWEHPQGIYYRPSGLDLKGKVVALFSGQGSQYLEMGREAVMNFPLLRRLYGEMDNLLLKDNLQPISEIVFPRPVFEEAEKNAQIAILQRTEYAQPAIGVFSAGLYTIFQQAGFKSDFTAGHSFGELTALWAAGVLSETDYLFLVKSRGQAMAAPEDPDHDAGSMLAVKEDINKVEAVLKQFPQVTIANFNSPTQVVLAGSTGEISKIRQALHNLGYAAVLLPVSAAFHTQLIAFAQKSFAIATKTVNFRSPKMPVFSNVTGKQYPKEPQAIQKNLESHLSNSVLFKQEIENIYAAGGRCFVEFGPKRILTNLVKEILGERPHFTISLNPSTQKSSDRSLREAAVQLRVLGMELYNLDPHQVPPVIAATEKKPGLNIPLNGINYVSEKTRSAFVQALQDGHQVTGSRKQEEKYILPNSQSTVPNPQSTVPNSQSPVPSSQSPVPSPQSPVPSPQSTVPSPQSTVSSPQSPVPSPQSPVPSFQSPKMQTTPEKLVNYQRILESLEQLLAQFQQNQSDNLQVHSTYLEHQIEYARNFFQLIQQQHTLLTNSKSHQSPNTSLNGGLPEAAKLKQVVMESLERSMMQFHNQQGETLRIHEQYLREQVEYTKNFFQIIQQEYSQLLTETGTNQPVESTNGVGNHHFLPLTPEPSVAEKHVPSTVQMVEAPPLPVMGKNGSAVKLGNSSNVVAPVTVEAPVAPIVEPEPTSTISISAGVANLENLLHQETPKELPNLKQVVSDRGELPQEQVPKELPDLAKIGQSLLTITSDKTGYPLEMLEFEMDMEADLGIDSIKRVEILGALQELYPDLPKPNLEELAEKRTIAQIVEYLSQCLARVTQLEASGVQSFVSPNTTVEIAVPEVQLPPEETAVAADLIVHPETSTPKEFADLSQTLLAITSEKTGYPVEMLELDMDMEADLGIDSIKRVEILGAMQETHPDLPQPNLEELGEIRTIGQIVDYLQGLAGGEKKKDELEFDPELDSNGFNFGPPPDSVNLGVPRRPVQLKTLPRPDCLEFTPPEEHIALITNDGSLTTPMLAQSLINEGWKVAVISFPQAMIPYSLHPLPPGVTHITLANLSEENLQQQIQAIAAHCGPIGAFIHLHPVLATEVNGKTPFLAAEKAIVKYVFLMAKHLKQALNKAANEGRSCFCTVTRLDGAFGLEYQHNFGVIGAGLFGLTKSLRWEWPNVSTRAIDLSPTCAPQESVEYIIAELHDPNRCISEVGYGSQGRVTLVAKG